MAALRRFTLVAVACSLVVATTANADRPRHETTYQQAARIVRAVFPDSTEAAALRVVSCETGGTYSPWSYNRSSAATGYFQILQGNAGRVLHYAGHVLVIPGGARLFNPWVNARVALFLSYGGTDWHEWSCQP